MVIGRSISVVSMLSPLAPTKTFRRAKSGSQSATGSSSSRWPSSSSISTAVTVTGLVIE